MYIKPLNYSDVLKQVIFERHGHRNKNCLNMDENLDAIGEAHKRMRQHIINERKRLTQS